MRRTMALAVLIWLSGCGGSKSESTPPGAGAVAATPSFEPCSVLTAAEIEATVGWKVVSSRPIPQGAIGYCIYSGPDETAATGPQKVQAGIGACPTNMPCTELPAFGSAAELVAFRRKGYEGKDLGGLGATIEPIEDLGVPAIRHELGGLEAVEMSLGAGRLAFVETWGTAAVARDLAAKVLGRVR